MVSTLMEGQVMVLVVVWVLEVVVAAEFVLAVVLVYQDQEFPVRFG